MKLQYRSRAIDSPHFVDLSLKALISQRSFLSSSLLPGASTLDSLSHSMNRL